MLLPSKSRVCRGTSRMPLTPSGPSPAQRDRQEAVPELGAEYHLPMADSSAGPGVQDPSLFFLIFLSQTVQHLRVQVFICCPVRAQRFPFLTCGLLMGGGKTKAWVSQQISSPLQCWPRGLTTGLCFLVDLGSPGYGTVRQVSRFRSEVWNSSVSELSFCAASSSRMESGVSSDQGPTCLEFPDGQCRWG